jgi:hypothetical protein
MTTLSICIPSHAPLSAAQTSIDSALALLPYGDIEVVVSDNSEDEQKAAYYGLLQREGFRYLRSVEQDPMRNWSHAVDNASGTLVIDLTPVFSTTGRLVKSDFQGEIGHEEVEIH